jgi:hypothetical protein
VELLNFEGKRMAIYLRRSKGETGTTKDQLEELLPLITRMEKANSIKKINRNIGGRDIDKKRRGIDLEGEFDIWNEGEGQSGYSVAERPVFIALLEAVRQDVYDGVIAVSMDRYARNYGALSRYAYDLFDLNRKPPKIFFGVAENIGLGITDEDEVLISALMGFGGLAKRIEIKKGEKKRKGTSVDKGYLVGSTPEWPGKVYRKKTSPGVDYRLGFTLHEEGKSKTAIAKGVGKTIYRPTRQITEGDRGWTNTWIPKMINFKEMNVLDDWLANAEAVADYIISLGPQPKSNYKQKEVANLLKHTRGYFGYPAGVNLANTNEFVLFPSPLDIGIDRLAAVSNPLDLDDFQVIRNKISDSKIADLNVAQTQPRASKK